MPQLLHPVKTHVNRLSEKCPKLLKKHLFLIIAKVKRSMKENCSEFFEINKILLQFVQNFYFQVRCTYILSAERYTSAMDAKFLAVICL